MAADIERQWELAQDALVLQSADFSLATLHQMVSSEQVDISPRYQRRERWNRAKQAELIESFLLNMPVPPIYLAEESIGKYSVIDGKQRLTAITAFLGNELHLDGLRSFDSLDGLSVDDLPDGVKTGLAVRPLRVVTVLRQSDENLKYEVFRRLNESAVPLNPQEIRNVLFRGPFNDLLIHLSEHPFLRTQLKITKGSERYKKMTDVEMVLRFFTLHRDWREFGGDYRDAMDVFMKDNRDPAPTELQNFQDTFDSAITRCEELWGEYAFRRPEDSGWRDQPLTGLYDAEMIAAHALSDVEFAALHGHRDRVALELTRELFQDAEFDDAVREATNTPNRVLLRMERMTARLKKAAAEMAG